MATAMQNPNMQQMQQQQEKDSINTSKSSPAIQSGDKHVNLYASIFSSPIDSSVTPPPGLASQPPTPSSSPGRNNRRENGTEISSSDRRVYLAHLMIQYRAMEDKYGLCFSHLQDAVEEVNTLRQEISRLRKANTELSNQLIPFTPAKTLLSPLSLLNDIHRLSINDFDSVSIPTNHSRYDQQQHMNIPLLQQMNMISLPKSISVRSSGYGNTTSADSTRSNISGSTTFAGSQRVRVPAVGGNMVGEEEGLELDAYGQGMFKTELCNKWEETGTCPYGDRCQFAHGIGELGPVIRHPRYKTEVCRMVLAGEACPYGHRCHFRHALVPNDRCYLGAPSS